ncbi:transposase [Bacteroidia bacterium]|nr:transposase [Bacteroidia bacterium]
MFIRKKKNPSGVVSVQVIGKSNGKYQVIKTVGSSSDAIEIERLYQQGKKWLSAYLGERDMFAEHTQEEEEKQVTEALLSNIENILLNGTQLILNQVFELVGFNRIDDGILKHLVVSRICQPRSKAATVDYLKSHFDEDVELHKIYRYLDKSHDTQKNTVQQISVEHTRRLLGGKIGLVFYDVTTLYFETDSADELRKTGFSKDGKHAQPQIILGLLVSAGGYPLAYSIHEGNKYEGHTMLPVIEDFVKQFDLSDFVVVADSGLMNNDNIELLEAKQYKYIIGARIKNESNPITKWILSLEKEDGEFYEYQKTATSRLIVGYSENRAKKDCHNREKGIKRLEKEYKSGIITKDKVNKRGYNKFLEISDNIKANINYDKTREDACWDGLKGYISNTTLAAKVIYEEYSGLWQVERAFRITKGTLALRPVFHFTKKRIEAHACICFVAYKVYKELERILKTSGINLSVDKVLDIAKTITTLKIKLPISNETMTKTMLLTPRHKSIAKLFDENFWETI